MSTYIASLLIPADQAADQRAPWRAAVTALPGNDSLCAWLENPRDASHGLQLNEALSAANLLSLIDHWPIGRVFNNQIDLRWEKLPGGEVQLVLIGDGAPPAHFDQDFLELEAVGNRPSDMLLWGERKNNGPWRETRIPRLDDYYPKHWAGPYAAMSTRSYETTGPEPESVRIVVRYLGYNGAVKL